MDETLSKGGYSKLFKILKSKYPHLSKNEVDQLIIKTRNNNGGTLSGLKMLEILKTIKNILIQIEKEKEQTEKDEQTCKVCYKMFAYKWTCKRHMREEHRNFHGTDDQTQKNNNDEKEKQGKVGDYCCNICNKTYTLPQNLQRHMKVHQDKEEDEIFKCKYCDKKFSRKDNKLRHEQSIHNSYQINFTAAGSQSSLKCNICNFDFGDDKEKLFAHLSAKVCESNKFTLDEDHRFECDLCDKSYLGKDDLVKHMRWKHSKEKVKLNCKLCTSKFQYNSTLVRHMKKIHGVE